MALEHETDVEAKGKASKKRNLSSRSPESVRVADGDWLTKRCGLITWIDALDALAQIGGVRFTTYQLFRE